MPFLTANKVRHFYRVEGVSGRPVLVLSHSISTDHSLWDVQMPDLLRHFQVLRYDTRGHGASDAPATEYSVEQLGRDAVALVNALGIENFAWCGLSLGGAIGQWIALNFPGRITQLILANTSPKFGDVSTWNSRMQSVREGGMAAIVEVVMRRFFSEKSRASENPYVASTRAVFLGTDPVGYIGCCAALRDFDSRPLLPSINVPCLIISGDSDPATPWTGNGEVLARQIPNAKAVHLPTAHLSNVEQPRSFTTAALEFLIQEEQPNSLELGFATRRQVLGDAYVDRAIAKMNDFNRDFQHLITRYAWAELWSRPFLDNRTRRLLVLAIMAALGRWEEFRLHFTAGLEHELEPCDVREALLLVTIYAGVPSANTAFHIAQEVISSHERRAASRQQA